MERDRNEEEERVRDTRKYVNGNREIASWG